MKLFEYADYIKLPDGRVIDHTDAKSYPFLYLNDEDFFIGDEGGTHIVSLGDYFYRIKNQEYLNIDPNDHDEIDNFLYSYLDTSTFTGRVWVNDKVISFWDLSNGAVDRKRMKDIIKNLEEKLNININPKEWWLEFTDVQTTTPYFVILNDFIENNDLKYGELDRDKKITSEVRRAWHLLNSKEKLRLKKEYGMDYKLKHKPLDWKQALLRSESIKSFEQFNESLRDKMTGKSYDHVINLILKNKVEIDEYVDTIKNSILHYLKINNIDINDVIIIDDEDALKFISNNLIESLGEGDVKPYVDDREDLYPFTYYNYVKDKIILMHDDYGELSVALINLNKLKEKLQGNTNESLIDKMTPKSNEEIIKLISSPESKLTPTEKFIEASRYGILSFIKTKLIEDENILKYNDYIPFYMAIQNGHLDIVKFMVNYIDDKEIIKYGTMQSKNLNQIDIFNYLKNMKNIRKYENFNVSLQINNKSEDMHINERVEAKMDLPQDVLDFHKLFEKKGYKLYVVGGAVRDFLMGKIPHDFDMASNATPDIIMDILKDYRTDLQGVHFGVVRVFTKNEPAGYEIASYRKDIYS